jgi:uncharacterized protein (TIGR00297 family)
VEETVNVITLLVGAGLAVLIAGLAYALGSLSATGALGAVLVGTATFGIGGLVPGILLILFFVSSSALSRFGGSRKRAFAAAFSKGSRRDHGQVFANGGLAAVLAALYGLTGQMHWLIGVAGALAAVNADTWATELGVLARHRPRLITTGVEVEAGTSGGVTLEGTLAAVGGSALISLTGGLLGAGWPLAVAALAGGLAGMLFDSLLGATVQAMYYCPTCARETERHPQHSCGSATERVRGWPWLRNDEVNFAASVIGAGFTLAVWSLI